MHTGKFIFSQILAFIPNHTLDSIVRKHAVHKSSSSISYWNHLAILMYGQLHGCKSLRGLTDIISAQSNMSYHLGFGSSSITRANLSRLNKTRKYQVFEEFAYHMISLAQDKKIDIRSNLGGKYYAFDSTTISLCLSIFKWAPFRSKKAGIKLHTQFDIETKIPTFVHITPAKTADVKAMDEIDYEPGAFYVFDKGYYDLTRLFRISQIGAFFVIREKGRPKFEITHGDEILDGTDNVIQDMTIRFSNKKTRDKYPIEMRRIVYYAEDLNRSFVYYTNNYELSAEKVALLYKYRWQVELFFRWIKQHLQVQTFWGTEENAVRIQIYTAIITYCTIAIIEHELQLKRDIYEVMRILGAYLFCKMPIRDLFYPESLDESNNGQLKITFG